MAEVLQTPPKMQIAQFIRSTQLRPSRHETYWKCVRVGLHSKRLRPTRKKAAVATPAVVVEDKAAVLIQEGQF